MDLEDRRPANKIGALDRNLAVKPTGPQQRGVEDVGAVGCGDQDDAARDVETVHFDEHLVEGLFTLVVTAA